MMMFQAGLSVKAFALIQRRTTGFLLKIALTLRSLCGPSLRSTSLVIFDRQTLSCVSRDPNTGRPIIDSNGCFQGYPCVPSECEKCRTTLRDSAPANFLGQIHIMVQQGIITRPRFDLLCPACNHVNSWDPATELIHTIRNGAYGGNSWSKLFVL